MIWRGIFILFAHTTVILLALSGFHWLEQGIGLNPLIAFPSAVLVFAWTWFWIASEAIEANIKIEDYLEYLDRREWLLKEVLKDHPDSYMHQIEANLEEIERAREILE
jgi:hypothetical protein